jgi:hypothetical protein
VITFDAVTKEPTLKISFD